jgi:hypothetical protein
MLHYFSLAAIMAIHSVSYLFIHTQLHVCYSEWSLTISWSWTLLEKLPELPNMLWHPKVLLYSKEPSTGPYPARSINPISLRSILILFTHLHLGLSSVSFLLAFPLIFYTHSSSCYTPCPSHSPWLCHFNYTKQRVEIRKLLMMQMAGVGNLQTEQWLFH